MERELRQTILEHSEKMPIVSVSHERLEFGKNICVGPIEQSVEHVFMQLRIGAELAETRFLAVCEADTLYPPQFFRFQPSRTDTYYYPKHGYIIWQGRSSYYRKHLRELTGIVARDHLLQIIEVMQKKWVPIHHAQCSGCDVTMRIDAIIAEIGRVEHVDLGDVVTLKTKRGMHSGSPYARRRKTDTLPTWGPARNMWEKYRCE